MKPLVLTLAGAAVALALIADPAAAQRTPPAGGGGGGGSTNGGASVRGGGDGPRGGSSGGSSGGSTAPSPSTGGTASSGGSSSYPGGSTYGGSSAGSGARIRGGGGAGVNPDMGYMRPGYGTAEDRAVPRGARPNPGVPSTGDAVLRNPGQASGPGGPGYPGGPGHRPGDPGYGYPGYPYYPYYPYNPYYLYGYGAFGLGYLYYDPFWWGYGDYYGGYGYGGYGYGGYEAPVGRGGLKLKVEPKTAEVFIDGYYMGTVDDFDGTFQKMELEVGAHRVEIRAIGFQTIAFDVRIEPNDTITYRGELLPAAGIKR